MIIPFCKSGIGEEEIESVSRVMRSGWMAAGPETEAFEDEFGKYIAEWTDDNLAYVQPYCVFTNSCTSALKIAYKWAKKNVNEIYEGDNWNEYESWDMWYPKNTFCATYSAAEEMGINMHSYSPSRKKELATESRVNMHYGGVKDATPCLIEDSAHRIEKNDPLVGKIRTYSFYVTKNMTTGSGGMFVTHDKEIYDFARLCWKDGLSTSTHERQSGRAWDYRVRTMAGGYDGNDIAAAIGRVQLSKLPEFTRRRNQIRDQYNASFGVLWQGNHLYPVFVNEKDQVGELIAFMKDKGVSCGYHYPGTGWLGVSLPLYPSLTDTEVEYVIDCVKEWRGNVLRKG